MGAPGIIKFFCEHHLKQQQWKCQIAALTGPPKESQRGRSKLAAWVASTHCCLTQWKKQSHRPGTLPPSLTDPASLTVEPSRGSWDTSDSTVQLAASGYKEATLGTHRPRTPLPTTSHHMGGALRPKWPGNRRENPPPQRIQGIFYSPGDIAPLRSLKSHVRENKNLRNSTT